jgi:hypothetical protein
MMESNEVLSRLRFCFESEVWICLDYGYLKQGAGSLQQT